MFNKSKEIENCPNCDASIKEGFLFSNLYLSDSEVEIIRLYYDQTADVYCEKCGREPLEIALDEMYEERAELQNKVQKLIDAIPVITTSTPHLWEYEVVGMVTGQSTTGTGVFSDFYSNITDLFGLQSESYNKKLRSGEDLCYAQLRLKTLHLGGNAVIATDIDYSEVGVEKGMLMVAMAGTAVKLTNTQVLGKNIKKNVEELSLASDRLQLIQDLLEAED